MTQRKVVFMKFEDSLFLHFSEFFGEGAPVEVQVVGEALAVEGDRKGVGAGFGRLREEVDQHAFFDCGSLKEIRVADGCEVSLSGVCMTKSVRVLPLSGLIVGGTKV